MHGADYIVKDVCPKCNSSKLSALDAYFCSLYDEYFKEPRGIEEVVELKYDYDLLTRSLLKIAYNTARSVNSEIDPFKRLTEYILEGASRPSGVVLMGELVAPTFIEDNTGIIPVVKEIRPTMYRSALGQPNTPNAAAILARIVAVNSFFFHILIARKPDDEDTFIEAVSEYLDLQVGAEIMYPDNKSVTLRTSPQDSLSTMLPWIEHKRDDFREYFKKHKKRH